MDDTLKMLQDLFIEMDDSKGLHFLTLASCVMDNKSQKLMDAKAEALNKLYSIIFFDPKCETILSKVKYGWYIKKSNYILAASSVTEIMEIMKPASPIENPDGSVSSPTRYPVKEEELVILSLASFHAPLKSKVINHMKNLMLELLPEFEDKLSELNI